MTNQEMLKRIAELEAKLAMANRAKTRLEIANGYIKVYGIQGKGRFDISATIEGFEQLFSMADEIRAYAKTNAAVIDAGKQAYQAKKQAAIG